MKARVLAHIRQVGCDQTDRSGTELARSLGGKAQRQRRTVGVSQRSEQKHVGVRQFGVQRDQ
jgi:hypothetical protein